MTGDHEVFEQAFARIEAQLAEQTKAIRALEEKSDLWHKPALPGGRSRIDQVEEVISAVKASKLLLRAFAYTFAFIISTASAIAVFSGWFPG